MSLFNSTWWKWQDGYIIVKVRNAKKKFPYNKLAEYYEPIQKGKLKLAGYYYKVLFGSPEQVQLFKELQLTDRDEIKEKRKKRVKK